MLGLGVYNGTGPPYRNTVRDYNTQHAPRRLRTRTHQHLKLSDTNRSFDW